MKQDQVTKRLEKLVLKGKRTSFKTEEQTPHLPRQIRRGAQVLGIEVSTNKDKRSGKLWVTREA